MTRNKETTMKTLTIKAAGNRARRYLGTKASPSDVGRLAAELIRISRMTSASERTAAELKALETVSH
jgi:hypothetical protein